MTDYFQNSENAGPAEGNAAANEAQQGGGGEDLGMAEISVSREWQRQKNAADMRSKCFVIPIRGCEGQRSDSGSLGVVRVSESYLI
jgi:hypothetical protein